MRGRALAVIVAFGVIFPFLANAQVSLSQDNQYTGFDSSVRILQPKYWLAKEKQKSLLNGGSVDQLLIYPQSEMASRTTRIVVVLKGSAANIFGLPKEVVSRVSPLRLVNFYIDQSLRNSLGAHVISTRVTTQGGSKVYEVEWSALIAGGNRGYFLEKFVFKGDQVYQVDAESSDIGQTYRDAVKQVADSFEVLK